MKLLSRKDEVELERERHRWRSFSVFRDGTGMYEVRGRLDPEVAAVLMRAIEAASDALYGSTSGVEEIEPQQRRADALGLVTERALAAGFGEATVDARNASRPGDASAEAHDLPPASGAGPRNGVSAKAPGAAPTVETPRPANASAEALEAPATTDVHAVQTDSAEAQRAGPVAWIRRTRQRFRGRGAPAHQ